MKFKTIRGSGDTKTRIYMKLATIFKMILRLLSDYSSRTGIYIIRSYEYIYIYILRVNDYEVR